MRNTKRMDIFHQPVWCETGAIQKQVRSLLTIITIGYDVPWQTVNELLIEAALKTEYILDPPRPCAPDFTG